MALKDWKIKKRFIDGAITWESKKSDNYGNRDELGVFIPVGSKGWEFVTDNPNEPNKEF